jgi:Ca2+-binding RTX toxin-like protein
LFYNDVDDALVGLSASDITVYDTSNNVVTATTLVDNGDSITIKGLQAGWTFEITSTTEFNAVKIEAATGTSEFKLGVFSYGEDSDGLPIELDYNIIGTDGDGDSITGSLDVNLYPAGATLEGDDLNNMLNGTNNTDYLLGRDGNDILFGNGGDDLLIGGYGDDEMTGGSGKDAFLFSLAANSGNDTIKDFEAGNDKLNFIDVLDLDGNSQFNLNDAINAISDSGASGDITISLNNGGSVTLQGIGTGAVNDIGALQTLLGVSNITADES